MDRNQLIRAIFPAYRKALGFKTTLGYFYDTLDSVVCYILIESETNDSPEENDVDLENFRTWFHFTNTIEGFEFWNNFAKEHFDV